MKSIYTFFLLFIIHTTWAQVLDSDFVLSNLYSIDVDGENIVTGGSCDQFWLSTDGGDSWDYSDKVDFSPLSVKIIKGTDQVLLCGLEGAGVYDISDMTYTPVYTNERVNDIAIVESHAYFLSNYHVVKCDLADWSLSLIATLDDSGSDFYRSMDASENFLFLGSEEGVLSKVNLANEEVQTAYTFGSRVGGMSWANDMVGYIEVSGSNDFFVSKDGGATMQNTSLIESASALAYTEDIMISLNTNRIVLSMDGGMTSEFIDTKTTPQYSLALAGTFTDDGTLYICGYAGMIVKTSDFGHTIEHLNAFNRVDCHAIGINNDDEILAAGLDGYYKYSQDNGNTWEDGFIEGLEDSGFQWSIVHNDAGDFYLGNETALYEIVESNPEVVLTGNFKNLLFHEGAFYQIDNGDELNVHINHSEDLENWTTLYSTTGLVVDQNVSLDGDIIIGLKDAYIRGNLSSSEWYKNDIDIDASLEGKSIREINFVDENIGYLIVNGQLYKTLDGETWNKIYSGYLMDNLQILGAEQLSVSRGSSNKLTVMESLDSGNSFQLVDSYCSIAFASTLASDHSIYYTQRFGGVVRSELSMPVSSLDELPSEPIVVSPNPVQNGSLVSFDQLSNKVRILDTQGRVVYFKTNTNQIEVPAYLATGIYFLQIENSDKVSVVKLMVE